LPASFQRAKIFKPSKKGGTREMFRVIKVTNRELEESTAEGVRKMLQVKFNLQVSSVVGLSLWEEAESRYNAPAISEDEDKDFLELDFNPNCLVEVYLPDWEGPEDLYLAAVSGL